MKHKVALATGVTAAVIGSIGLTMPPGNAATTSPERPDDTVSPALAAASSASALVATRPKLFYKGAHDQLINRPVVRQDGLQYVAYERTYKGLPVQGGDAVVVTNSAGAVLSKYVAQEQALSVDTAATIPAAWAERIARRQLARVDSVDAAKLTVVAQGPGVLAYEVVVTGAKKVAGGLAPSRLHVFVDADNGEVLGHLTRDDVVDASGTGAYYGKVTLNTRSAGGGFSMVDPTRPGVQCGGQNGGAFTNSTDVWGNGRATDQVTGCVDALYAVSQEWNMLRDWLGRDGIDGHGRGFPIRVGLNDVNAYWAGEYAEFGHSSDGGRLLTAIDVVGHEFGHAINQFTPGGVSDDDEEAGGLGESTGDIFAALTEFYANNAKDRPDYEVGELANLNGDGPIRYMYDPSKAGHPNCYSSRIPITEEHAAAGPQNHWFYLLAEGSRPANGRPASPTCNNSSVRGIGIQKAGKIYMSTLMRKTSGWTHAKARAASVAAAAQLFGGTECATVKAAWDAVSVQAGSNEPSCAGGPAPTPTGGPTPTPAGGLMPTSGD